jgi:hypothetical protein
VRYPPDWILKTPQGAWYETDHEIISLNSPSNERLLQAIEEGKVYGEAYREDIIINYYPASLRSQRIKLIDLVLPLFQNLFLEIQQSQMSVKLLSEIIKDLRWREEGLVFITPL